MANKRITNIFKNPFRIILYLLRKCAFMIRDDEFYVKCYYYLNQHAVLNLKSPKLFTEKIQWLKLHDRNPLYRTIVDKITVKEYVKSIIGEKYVIPTLRVFDSLNEIDISALPERFVLKTNSGGG